MLFRSRILAKFSSERPKSRLINPYTHQQLTQKYYNSIDQIYGKVTSCSYAQQQWKTIPVEQRRLRTGKFVETILSQETFLKTAISEQIGKSFKNISQQFERSRKIIWDLINSSNQILQSKILRKDKQKFQYIERQSVGLSLIFPYYSEPILDSIMHLVPCLISGGGALLKPSDYNHFLGEYLQKKCQKILGISGLITQVFIHPNQLAQLAQFRSIKKVIYSGRQSSAKHIFQTLVKNRFIDCNLFFGGQDAAYVDQTADLKKAAKQIAKFAFYNNGQSFECIKRLYVHQSVIQQFTQYLVQETLSLKIGDPTSQETDLGPLCVPQVALQVQRLISEAVNNDTVCETGGMITNDGASKGIFIEPTILSKCTSDTSIIHNQIAAPILSMIQVSSKEEFINFLNDNKYGTGVRIYTSDTTSYQQDIDRIQVGRISFNSPDIICCNLPIEGWKQSGKGKILSSFSYQQYTVPKVFNINRMPFQQ